MRRFVSFAAILGSLACASTRRALPPLPPGHTPIFEDVARKWGVDFRFDTDELSGKVVASMGGGSALADFDRDGDLDLYLVNSIPKIGSPADPRNCSKLYRNDGPGRFTDVSKSSGAEWCGYGMGVFWVDLDSDGRDDLYLTGIGGNLVLRNETPPHGEARFVDVTERLGQRGGNFCVSMNAFDDDGDGDVDLYVANYLDTTPEKEKSFPSTDVRIPEDYEPQANVFWRNVGAGEDGLPRYVDVTDETGTRGLESKSLAVAVLDWNRDGHADLFVASDRTPNVLYTNLGPDAEGKIRYANNGEEVGVAFNSFGKHPSGMGTFVGDLDSDGWPEIFVTNFANEWNSLYHCIDGAVFEDATERSGLGPPSYPKVGWGTVFFDYDSDGRDDVAVMNGGLIRDLFMTLVRLVAPPAKAAMYDIGEKWHQAPLLFHNEGDLRFTDTTDLSGDYGEQLMVARGLAAGDLDGDGALDLVTVDQDGPARVFRNRLPAKSWFEIELIPGADRKTVYGAVVEIDAGPRHERREWYVQPSYASGSSVPLHFGLGDDGAVDRLTVTWPGGDRVVIENPSVKKRWTLRKGETTLRQAGK